MVEDYISVFAWEEVNEKLLASSDFNLNIGVITEIVRTFYYEGNMC
jgi:hypothetical protein